MKGTISLTLLSLILSTGCLARKSTAELFVERLNAQDSNNTFVLVKTSDYHNAGRVIIVGRLVDPDHDGVGYYDYQAIDITMHGIDGHPEEALERYNDHRYSVYSVGNGNYQDTDGHLYEVTSMNAKDLEKLGAVKEVVQLQTASEKLTQEFGLSEERSFEIVKLTSAWKKLKSKRELTDADADTFSTELLGFNLGEAQTAYQKKIEGDVESFDKLIERAAEQNGVTPEHMNKIFGAFE